MEPNPSASSSSASGPPRASATASATAANAKARLETVVRPALAQLAVNMRIWAPFFSNPFHRSTLVRFSSEDDRVGLSWKVVLPRQCWQCGQKTGLAPMEYEQAIRAFDNPIAIVGGGLAAAFIGLILFLWMPGISTFVVLALIVIAASGLLLLKSWQEVVRLTMFSCPVHVGEMRSPEMAIDDQKLHVFLPTPELAATTADEIAERRKHHARSRTMAAEGSASERSFAAVEPSPRSAPAPSEAPLPFTPRSEALDLPPIKLAGDEDEPPAGEESSDAKQS